MNVPRPAVDSPRVTVDDSRWPLMLVTQRAAQLTDAERLESLEASDRVLKAHGTERYCMVLDNRKAGPMPATQRKMIAEYMERNSVRARTRCVGTAFVSDSVVMRAMLTAIMWLRKPEVETQVFGDLDEATAWAASMYQRASGSPIRSIAPAR